MPKLKIKDIIIGPRHRKDLGDIEGLAESMRKCLFHPPIVTERNELVAGFRRLKAAEFLGWTEIEVRVINPENMLEAEHDENELRKDFTLSERVAIAESIKCRLEQCGQLPTGEKARDKAAVAAGFSSTDQYRRSKAVVEQGVPELVEALDKGEVSASAAATVAGLPKDEQREAVKTQTVAEAAKERQEALKREKQRTIWIRLIGTKSKGLMKNMLADPDSYSDEALLKSLPKCCDKCRRQGPPPRPCGYCEALRKPSLLDKQEPEDEGNPESPPKFVHVKHPFKEHMELTTKLSGMLTKAIMDRGPFNEKLTRFLSAAGMVEHKTDKERTFLNLQGVKQLLDAAGKEADHTDKEIQDMHTKACGTAPFVPERTRFNRAKKRRR